MTILDQATIDPAGFGIGSTPQAPSPHAILEARMIANRDAFNIRSEPTDRSADPAAASMLSDYVDARDAILKAPPSSMRELEIQARTLASEFVNQHSLDDDVIKDFLSNLPKWIGAIDAGRTAVSQFSPSADPIVDYSIQYNCLQRVQAASEERREFANDPVMNAAAVLANDRRDMLENVIARTPAASLVGAMLQLKLAHADVDCLESYHTDDRENDAIRFRLRISHILYSAIAAIERATGIDRDRYGVLWMHRSGDPFTILANAEAKLEASG